MSNLLNNINEIISHSGTTVTDKKIIDNAVTVLELVHRIASTTWVSPQITVSQKAIYFEWSSDKKKSTLRITGESVLCTRLWGNETQNYMREDFLDSSRLFRQFWKWILVEYPDIENLEEY